MTGPAHTPDQAQERLRGLADAALYGSYAQRLLRSVARQVNTTPENIEDACHFAWAQYLSHAEQVARDRAHAWLATTAIRHAYKLHARERRAGSLEAALERGNEPVARDDPARAAELRERLALLHQLPVRQQRMVWLQAAGLSYSEISARTGDSLRTTERQVLRARRRLAELQRAPAAGVQPLSTATRTAPAARL